MNIVTNWRKNAISCLEVGKRTYGATVLLEINDDNSKKGIDGHVIEYNNVAYIWFEPTNHKSDWWINFNATGVNVNDYTLVDTRHVYGDEKVHKGWIESFENIQGVIDSIPKLLHKDTVDIIISGHSLGAAIASLSSMYLADNYPGYNYEVYLFGSPKVGNNAFVELQQFLVTNTFSFHFKDDIVGLLPYNFLFLITGCIYEHVSYQIQLGAKREWYRFLTGNFGKDHEWKDYYNALKNGDIVE